MQCFWDCDSGMVLGKFSRNTDQGGDHLNVRKDYSAEKHVRSLKFIFDLEG